jgi:hypothetical protein
MFRTCSLVGLSQKDIIEPAREDCQCQVEGEGVAPRVALLVQTHGASLVRAREGSISFDVGGEAHL